jgi:hypothetical protein
MSLAFACDGPEDCPAATPLCCADVNVPPSFLIFTTCSSGCGGVLNLDNLAAAFGQGRVCHTTSDCIGANGQATFMGSFTSQDFPLCCEIPRLPGLRHCAPATAPSVGAKCL